MSELPAGRRASGVIVKAEDVPAEALETSPVQVEGPEFRIYKRDAVRVAEELTGRQVKAIERRNQARGCILEVMFPDKILGFSAPAWFEALSKLKGYLDKTKYVRPPRDATPVS